MADLLPVAFHGDTLYLVEHNGEPFAPAKPICEAIGLDWSAQFTKLKSADHRWGSEDVLAVANDGKQRSMICLPVRKLSAWLYSITPAKVAPELRAKIEAYQAECDDALWRYWTEGRASREVAPQQAPALPSRPRSTTPVKLCSFEVRGSRIEAARLQLEAAAGLLCGIEFARDHQTRLDLLVAAHTQCQAASLFIANHYEEVRGHA